METWKPTEQTQNNCAKLMYAAFDSKSLNRLLHCLPDDEQDNGLDLTPFHALLCRLLCTSYTLVVLNGASRDMIHHRHGPPPWSFAFGHAPLFRTIRSAGAPPSRAPKRALVCCSA
jgi:hypothetical protein